MTEVAFPSLPPCASRPAPSPSGGEGNKNVTGDRIAGSGFPVMGGEFSSPSPHAGEGRGEGTRASRLALVPAIDHAGAPAARLGLREQKLWLCVHLPRLAVDVFGGAGNVPLVATEPIRNRILVIACNKTAEKHGVRAGMPLGAALSLCNELQSLPRNCRAECEKLNVIAAAAYGLSSEVSFYGEDSIVLEIRGSRTLFGGMRELLRRARKAFTEVGVQFVFGIAVTPRAASWLARWCPGRYVWFADELPGALRPLPIHALVREEKQLRQLERSGIRTLGALMRLPRAGVARRFSPALLHTLDQALGRKSEPLALYSPPQDFHAVEELLLPASDWPRLAPLAEKLLRRLEHYLLRRQAATQRVECLLWHEHEPETVLKLNLTRYERQATQLLDLLQKYFEKTVLPAEVTALGIHCGEIHVMPAENLHLLGGRAAVKQHWSRLLDRLIARVGEQRLSKPIVRADHRPEKNNERKKGTDLFSHANYRSGPAVDRRKNKSVPFFERTPFRPAWLLSQPELLDEGDDRPRWNGPLELSRLPERIEQGWWDGHDMRRDYYLAKNPQGTRLWVFRDRRDRQWYLHGVFA